MLRFIDALTLFTFAIIAAVIIGLLIRCFREKINFILWPVAFFMYAMHVIGDIVIPFIIFYRTLFRKRDAAKKMSITRRIFLSFFSVPLAYVILIGSFHEMSNEYIWCPLRESTKRIKIMKQKNKKLKVYKKLQTSPKYFEIFSQSMLSSLRNLEHTLAR